METHLPRLAEFAFEPGQVAAVDQHAAAVRASLAADGAGLIPRQLRREDLADYVLGFTDVLAEADWREPVGHDFAALRPTAECRLIREHDLIEPAVPALPHRHHQATTDTDTDTDTDDQDARDGGERGDEHRAGDRAGDTGPTEPGDHAERHDERPHDGADRLAYETPPGAEHTMSRPAPAMAIVTTTITSATMPRGSHDTTARSRPRAPR